MAKQPDGSLYERVEELYVSEEFGIFFATGQPTQGDERKAYIAVKSMHTLTDEQNETLRAQAKPSSGAYVVINPNRKTQELVIYDNFTRTSSSVPLSALSPSVQEKYPPLKVPTYFDRLNI